MDYKDSDCPKIGLYDKSFEPLLKIMELDILNRLFCKQGVCLLFQNRYFERKGVGAIFTFYNTTVSELISNDCSLACVVSSVGAGVHLHQCNNIRVDRGDEIDDSLEVDRGTFEKTGKW